MSRLRREGVDLAYEFSPGRAPTTVFLPGFRSDMTGQKALAVLDHCRDAGRAMLRLDYAGHGASSGRFEDGTIGSWTGDALAVIEATTTGPCVLVGSSMGGWIALLLALARPNLVAGIVGIAAAPDFTERRMWDEATPEQREALARDGRVSVPSEYGEDLIITRALIEDGRHHLLLGGPIAVSCPVRLLQGQRDADVPWRTALDIAERLASEDVRVTLIKDGDHRLSREADIQGLLTEVKSLLF